MEEGRARRRTFALLRRGPFPYLVNAGLPHVRLDDLRHLVATELLTKGIDVRTVSNRLGHARMSTTMDIYSAFVPARDRDAADHFEAILRRV